MQRIQRTAKAEALFTARGQIQPEDIDQHKQLRPAGRPWQRLPVDLPDLAMVNQEPVLFLVTGQANANRLQVTSAALRESAQ